MRTIVLNEDLKGVCRSVCHTRGLIPFCLENPELRIERRIGLLTNLLPGGDSWSMHRSTWILGSDCIEGLVPWIVETALLPSHGMPAQSFRLIIEGNTKESLEAWELVKHAAAMQESMLEQCRLTNTCPTPAFDHHRSFYRRWPLPWHLPDVFFPAIRGIITGSSNIGFTGEVGELWDQDVFFFERKDWTLDQWEEEWTAKVYSHGISTDFWKASFSRYSVVPYGFRKTIKIVRNGPVHRG